MLARSGPLPTRGDWAYEVKWDGFRAIVSTEDAPLRVRSRRGWDMTLLVPKLSALPVSGAFEGELVALGEDGSPDFPLLCERMLMRRSGIHVTYVVFDVLSLDGEDLTRTPYSERRTTRSSQPQRRLLADSRNVRRLPKRSTTPETFDDGNALFDAVCAHELEGVVAKRRSSRYLPGERGWVKIKNRSYWRYQLERESTINKRRVKQFI
jgi:bifunctional non-homologous end joining protein LigD